MIHIMVVDDERDIEPLFRQRFRKEIRDGLISFHFAFSGEEALEYLRQAAAADLVLILSDINMPGMSGLELLENIKSKFPHIQVSMISAYGDRENYHKAINSGAKGFFTKPVDFESLKNEIAELLTKK